MAEPRLIRQRQKYDYKNVWLSVDPIPLKGEICFEIGEDDLTPEYDTYKCKLGDGVRHYSDLPYFPAIDRSTYTNITTDTLLDTIDLTSADGCKILYTVKQNENIRIGEILVVWSIDTSTVASNEVITVDSGDTSGITISFDIVGTPMTEINVNAIITSGTWTVKFRKDLI